MDSSLMTGDPIQSLWWGQGRDGQKTDEAGEEEQEGPSSALGQNDLLKLNVFTLHTTQWTEELFQQKQNWLEKKTQHGFTAFIFFVSFEWGISFNYNLKRKLTLS